MFGYLLHGEGAEDIRRLFLRRAACDVADSGNTTWFVSRET